MSTHARHTGAVGRDAADAGSRDPGAPRGMTRGELVVYLLFGIYFGAVLTKGEVISWFRIQEMFRLQGFHMYGILGSAVLVAGVSVAAIRRLRPGDLDDDDLPDKEFRGLAYRYWIGGTLFGLGWALIGACPGPVYALIGAGITVYIAALIGAVAGTWAYGALRPHLPHY